VGCPKTLKRPHSCCGRIAESGIGSTSGLHEGRFTRNNSSDWRVFNRAFRSFTSSECVLLLPLPDEWRSTSRRKARQFASEMFFLRSEFAVHHRQLSQAAEMERHVHVTSQLPCRDFQARPK